MAKQDGYTRYTVRIPNDLCEALKQSAAEASVNSEIIDRLEASFEGKPTFIDTLFAEPSFKPIPREKLGDVMILLGSLAVEYADFNDTAKKGGA